MPIIIAAVIAAVVAVTLYFVIQWSVERPHQPAESTVDAVRRCPLRRQQEMTPQCDAPDKSSDPNAKKPYWEACHWEHVKSITHHTDQILHLRINYFLVAQAFLFSAIAASWDKQPPLNFVIAGLGLVVTGSFWYAMARMEKALAFLCEVFEGICPLYGGQRAAGGLPAQQESRWWHPGSFGSSYTYLIRLVPLSIAFAWVFVLATKALAMAR